MPFGGAGLAWGLSRMAGNYADVLGAQQTAQAKAAQQAQENEFKRRQQLIDQEKFMQQQTMDSMKLQQDEELLHTAHMKNKMADANPNAYLPTPMQEALQKKEDYTKRSLFAINEWDRENKAGHTDLANKWMSIARAWGGIGGNPDPDYAKALEATINPKGTKAAGTWMYTPGAPGGSTYMELKPGMTGETMEAHLKKLAAGQKQTAADKFWDLPVSDHAGDVFFIKADGTPWEKLMMSRRDAAAQGALPISKVGKDNLQQIDSALDGMNRLLETGKDALPMTEGGVKNVVNPLVRKAAGALGLSEYQKVQADMITQINHLRAIAGVARVNASELNTVKGSITSATSYPALVAAINEAKPTLQKMRQRTIIAGRMDTPGNSGGKPQVKQKWAADGSKIYQWPNGKWYHQAYSGN